MFLILWIPAFAGMTSALARMTILFALLLGSASASAHHVLGRPAYSVNENSTTPPSMQVETQIGKYFVSYMLYPAFPKVGENGRIHLYATRIADNVIFDGKITFKVRDGSWFDFWSAKKEERLGVQEINDGVYLQGFVFKEDGDYIVTAEFEADGEPYVIDFPLQVGDPGSALPLGIAGLVIILVLMVVNLTMRSRLLRAKTSTAHEKHAL